MTAAAATVQFDVEYPEVCKECEKEGVSGVRTGFSFEHNGAICARGRHGQDAPVPQPAQARPRIPQSEAEEMPAAVGEAVEVQAPKPTVQVVGSQELEGGDLEIRLRIPERHVASVKGEAEVQGQTVEEYLQAWIETGLDNFWGR